MTTQQQVRFWLVGLAGFAGLLWLLSDMLLPFVAAMAIAYLLDPVTDRIERRGVARWLATSLVLLSFILLAVLATVLLFPLLKAQINLLIDSVPGWVEWARTVLLPRLERWVSRISPDEMERLRSAAQDFAGTAVGWVGELFRRLLSGGMALVDVLSLLFITPIVAFYLLRDWDGFVESIDRWLPRQHAETIREQAREVDRTLSGFVRGQASVCLVLAAFYGTALTLAGLKFGLVVGLLAGMLSFIPFVGSILGFAASLGIALFQFDQTWQVAIIVGIFLFGQAVEGNVLTPRLVGDRIGLHPVWVMFALLAAGSLLGFVGVLLALPMAAVIGVLVRFALRQYLRSPLYTGRASPLPPPLTEVGQPQHPAAEGALTHQPADLPQAP
jgi:predicted PurR-regulated permease PerM